MNHPTSSLSVQIPKRADARGPDTKFPTPSYFAWGAAIRNVAAKARESAEGTGHRQAETSSHARDNDEGRALETAIEREAG